MFTPVLRAARSILTIWLLDAKSPLRTSSGKSTQSKWREGHCRSLTTTFLSADLRTRSCTPTRKDRYHHASEESTRYEGELAESLEQVEKAAAQHS